jgi:hypothetical protein
MSRGKRRRERAEAKRICASAPVRLVMDAEIDPKRTEKGGWTRRQLAEWGVPWPPPKGWRSALVLGLDPRDAKARKHARAILARTSMQMSYEQDCLVPPWE